MKKLLLALLCANLAFGLVGCSSDAETKKEEDTPKEETKKKEEKKTYAIGEKVVVTTDLGKYYIVINGVTETADRNEFSDTPAERVVLISYTYENVSYEEDLYISDSNFKPYDKAGTKLEKYPVEISFPDAIGTGRNISASMAYALNSPDNYIELEFYDNMFNSKSDCMFEIIW